MKRSPALGREVTHTYVKINLSISSSRDGKDCHAEAWPPVRCLLPESEDLSKMSVLNLTLTGFPEDEEMA